MGLISDPEEGNLFEFEGYVTWMTDDAVKAQVDIPFEFKMPLKDVPEKGIKIGQVDAFNTVWTYLRNYEHVVKDGKDWRLLDQAYPKQEDLRRRMLEDPVFDNQVKRLIFQSVAAADELINPETI